MAITFYDIRKAIGSLVDSNNTPESFKIGEQFEFYVIKYHFDKEHYQVLERTHDYVTNKNYVQSSLNPDFKLLDKVTKTPFWLEAKFRNGSLINGKLEWCKPYQLKRYFDINKNCPVFIILGVEGSPGTPEKVYLFPLPKYNSLYPSYLAKYLIEYDIPVTSSFLWSLK